MVKTKLLIGRLERANLPNFGLFDQIVKIDSGAYTSSIHIFSVKEVGNQLEVQFKETDSTKILFDTWKTKNVKSSNGVADRRYTIEGHIILGDVEYHTPFTLTNRSGMRYPILIGRKLLNKKFIIDSSKVNVLSNSPKG